VKLIQRNEKAVKMERVLGHASKENNVNVSNVKVHGLHPLGLSKITNQTSKGDGVN